MEFALVEYPTCPDCEGKGYILFPGVTIPEETLRCFEKGENYTTATTVAMARYGKICSGCDGFGVIRPAPKPLVR